MLRAENGGNRIRRARVLAQKGKDNMGVYQRGKVWWYDFMVNGVRYRKPIKQARNLTQARDAETEARAAVIDGRYRAVKAVRFEKFVTETYLPWAQSNKRSYKADYWRSKALIESFGHLNLEEISVFAIERYKQDRKQGMSKYRRQRSPASVNREFELLSRILTMAVDFGLMRSNPCGKVRKLRLDNKRTRYLTIEEEQRLLFVCDGQRSHLKQLVILALNTGMRRGELLHLEAADVDVSRSQIYVRNTKSGKDRAVPINQAARGVFEKLLQLKPAGRIFEIESFKSSWRSACRDAEISDLRFHDLRHTFATRLADAGADAFTIAALLGHSGIVMASRYTHATDQGKREAVTALKMACHNFPTPGEAGDVAKAG